MPVNGIDLAVGQKWRTRRGDHAVIERFEVGDVLCWELTDGHRVSDNGYFWSSGCEAPGDLVEFLPSDAASHSTPVGEAFVWPATQPVAAVGDITSTAKGSGARYNSGKPAFELVPLRLVANSYLRRNRDSMEVQKMIEALVRLADFQERGKDNLLSIADLLGLEGWDDCAKVFDYGQKKYAAWNWSRGMAWSVPIACAARHLLAMIRGEVNDPESGLPHRGHVLCNISMLETYKQTYLEGDDRAPAGYLAPLLVAA